MDDGRTLRRLQLLRERMLAADPAGGGFKLPGRAPWPSPSPSSAPCSAPPAFAAPPSPSGAPTPSPSPALALERGMKSESKQRMILSSFES